MISAEKLLLCTDLDRTALPNGAQPESAQARAVFSQLCRLPQITLVYVGGRDKSLVQQAIADYSLPVPDYAVTDVGSKIYRIEGGHWQPMMQWETEIDLAWRGNSPADLQALFTDLQELTLQETEKQNTHKLSYYLPLQLNLTALLQLMQQRLEKLGVAASLVWSIDEPKGVGLLDVLPVNATKLHAVSFLRDQLHFSTQHVVFAGDSGNDLDIMVSEIPSVLVANASDDLKQQVQQQAQARGHEQAVYLARGDFLGMNGNYSAGILEGVWHFVPWLRDQLQGLK